MFFLCFGEKAMSSLSYLITTLFFKNRIDVWFNWSCPGTLGNLPLTLILFSEDLVHDLCFLTLWNALLELEQSGPV